MDNNVSKKDQIILRQLDVIRTMTENNINRMGTDFWGNPYPTLKVDGGKPEAPKPVTPPQSGSTGNSAASTGNDDTQAPPAEAAPPEKIEDLKTELDAYIGLAAIKREVSNLINMVQVYKLRRENDLPTTGLSLHMASLLCRAAKPS